MSAPTIERLQVFGARCSGTNWVDALVRANFLGVNILRSDIDGGSDNFGWKHGDLGTVRRHYLDNDAITYDGHGNIIWAEKDVKVAENDERYVGIDAEGDMYLKNCIIPIDWSTSANSLLIVVNRNPIEWLRSLHRKPHLALGLYNLPFAEFINRPWVTYACAPMGTLYKANKKASWIHKGMIVERQASVFEHRRVSLATFQTFPSRVQHVVFVPYETVLQDPRSTITEIADHYGIRTQPTFTEVTSYKGRGAFEYSGTTYEDIAADALAFVLERIDWEYEYGAGYSLFDNAGKSFTPQQLADPSSLVRVNNGVRYYRNSSQVL